MTKAVNDVFLCYLSREKKAKLIKIVSTFDDAKKWQHEQTKNIMYGELLYAKYLQSMHFKFPKITKKHHLRKNKHADAWFDHLRKHDYDGTEKRSSAYFHCWTVDTTKKEKC